MDVGLAGQYLTGSGTVYWPLADNQGTIRDIAELGSGGTQVVDHLVYNSLGKLISESNAAMISPSATPAA